MSDAKPAKSLPAKVVDGLASYGLASLLLLLMFCLQLLVMLLNNL